MIDHQRQLSLLASWFATCSAALAGWSWHPAWMCPREVRTSKSLSLEGYWRLLKHHGTVWMVGVNIYLKENDLPLPFAPTNICPLGCLDEVVNVDVDERGRAGPTTNMLQFATF
jgi:hypothetical protein